MKAELQQAPRDYPQRAQLAVLLFAEARVEECITGVPPPMCAMRFLSVWEVDVHLLMAHSLLLS